jgi:hypothetical protein
MSDFSQLNPITKEQWQQIRDLRIPRFATPARLSSQSSFVKDGRKVRFSCITLYRPITVVDFAELITRDLNLKEGIDFLITTRGDWKSLTFKGGW